MANRALVGATAGLVGLLAFGAAQAADVTVMGSGAFFAAFTHLAPAFETARGDHIIPVSGPSLGASKEAIPNRLARGETADVVILAKGSLDALTAQGRIVPGSQRDLVRSQIAMAVKAGAPHPDISTLDKFKAVLLSATSIVHSDSASGIYISSELYKKLGIEKDMAGKSRMIPVVPVGPFVARGEAQIGFQQLSELKPIPGIDIVGLLPEGAQRVTVFSAGIVVGARQPAEAKALINYLLAKSSNAAVEASGLEPINPPPVE